MTHRRDMMCAWRATTLLLDAGVLWHQEHRGTHSIAELHCRSTHRIEHCAGVDAMWLTGKKSPHRPLYDFEVF